MCTLSTSGSQAPYLATGSAAAIVAQGLRFLFVDRAVEKAAPVVDHLRREKRPLPTVPALGYVMWQPRNDQSRHAANLPNFAQYANIGSCPHP